MSAGLGIVAPATDARSAHGVRTSQHLYAEESERSSSEHTSTADRIRGWGLLPVVVAFLAAGLALRALWAALHPVKPVSDFAVYHQLAANLAEHGFYGQRTGTPEAYWPPGWPAALAGLYNLVGPEPQRGALLGVVFEWGAIVLAAVAAWRLLQPAFAAAAVAAMCLYPGGVAYGPVLGTEHLAALLFTASVVLVALATPSPALALGAGLLTGALLLTRADYGVAMAAIVALWLVRELPLRRVTAMAAVFAAGALVFLGPWIGRNEARFGEFIPTSTNGGVTFYLGTLAPGYTDSPVRARVYANHPNDGPKAIENRFWHLGFANVADDPVRWLKIDARRIRAQYGREGSLLAWGDADGLALLRLAQAYWLLVVAFALTGLSVVVARRRRIDRAWPMIVASILAVSLVKTFFVVNQRDRLPLTYLLIVVGALGAQHVVRLAARPDSQRR
jgi:hypothetical protein